MVESCILPAKPVLEEKPFFNHLCSDEVSENGGSLEDL